MAGSWNKPPDLSGPEAAFYQGFDTSDGLVSWEGTNQTCNVPLVSGKVMMNTEGQNVLETIIFKVIMVKPLFICIQVNMALNLNHNMKQWLDLGIHTEACMTQPETCGAAGGAISVWVNAIECPDVCGIISSWTDVSTGSAIGLYPSDLMYDSNITHCCYIEHK